MIPKPIRKKDTLLNATQARKRSVAKQPLLMSTQRNLSIGKSKIIQQGPANKLFNAFKQKGKQIKPKSAWQPKQDDPIMDYYQDNELQRLVSADMERELEKGINKSIQQTINSKVQQKPSSKAILPRIQGVKSIDEIDKQISKQLQMEFQRDLIRY